MLFQDVETHGRCKLPGQRSSCAESAALGLCAESVTAQLRPARKGKTFISRLDTSIAPALETLQDVTGLGAFAERL